MDPSELWANANRAINNLLHLKRSIDIKRQRAIWELGVMLCQNESLEAASVAAAKAIYSQSVLEAKNNFHVLQLWKPRQRGAIQSKKLRLPVPMPLARPGACKTSQAMMLHKEHGKYMQGLEGGAGLQRRKQKSS